MPRVRVYNLAISVDGFAAGPNQSHEHPLGMGGTRLHHRVFDGSWAGDECVEFVSSPAVAHVRFAREPT